MRRLKGIVLAAVLVLALGAAVTAYAISDYKTPAEALAGLTGSTPEAVAEQRAQGKTFGAIAQEAGVLDQFKAEMLEIRKAVLEEKVAEGLITQEEANEIIEKIEEKQAVCNGAGTRPGCQFGQGTGRGFGFESGQRSGRQGAGCRFGGGCTIGN